MSTSLTSLLSMSISNSWSSFSRSLIEVLRAVAVDLISLVALDIVDVCLIVDEVVAVGGGGGGVEAFVVGGGGGGGVEPFAVAVVWTPGDWERERSDEPVVDVITGGINLLIVDESVVG